MFALVDDADFLYLNKFKWQALRIRNKWYAKRDRVVGDVGGKCILMHREIFKISGGNKIQVDHINGDGLDNQKNNLRLCSNQQNNCNKSKYKTNTSGYKGVTFDKNSKRQKRWMAQITFSGKRLALGYFKDRLDAAKAYDEKAKELFGQFAVLNFNANVN